MQMSCHGEVTAAGGAAMPAIIGKFGPGAADSHGALDREHMAKKVFQNHRALDQLSAIVHQYVIEQIIVRVKKLEEKKTRAVVLDVPIPVKHGFLDLCDQVWVIWASDEIRLAPACFARYGRSGGQASHGHANDQGRVFRPGQPCAGE